ncbi:RNA chaperone Hfq, partial [Tenuibacillus multivorans]
MANSTNVQDTYLNKLRKEKVPLTVFLTNGFQLRGVLKSFDNFTILI